MGKAFYGLYFKFMRFIARIICDRYDIVGAADEAAPKVFISHHQNMYGPVMSMMWLKEPVHIWVLSHFCNKKDCYKHFIDYTFSKRFGWGRLRTIFVARLFSGSVSRLMMSAKAIPVFRESRKVMDTINKSIDLLMNNESLLIFPDIDYSNNDPDMHDIYKGFLYLEKYYYRVTGKHLAFVPLYVSQKTKSLHLGDAIYFKDNIAFADERENVSESIKKSVHNLAVACGDVN